VLRIARNGSYEFHSEAMDDAASNAGSFSAAGGHWSLRATSGFTEGGDRHVPPPAHLDRHRTAGDRHPAAQRAAGDN